MTRKREVQLFDKAAAFGKWDLDTFGYFFIPLTVHSTTKN
jgi:hypothetical protein